MCEGNPYAYFLALQRDVNSTSGTTQWFYFKASSAGAAGTYTFHIVNYVKPFSMFRVGMKPCVYSPSRGSKWERAGTDIDYRRNSLPYEQDENYYTLSFSYEFQAGEGDVYFAYCYPYTYSRLQRFLDAVEAKHFDRMRRKVIAKTLGGRLSSIKATWWNRSRSLIHKFWISGSFISQPVLTREKQSPLLSAKPSSSFSCRRSPPM